MQHLLIHDIDNRVEAFSTKKGSELPYHVIQPHQIHMDRIAIIDNPEITKEDLDGYDALITNLRQAAIGVRTADCVPVLIYDAKLQVIAAIHSGWKGTVLRIVQKTISKMIQHYGTSPKNIIAVIGPSIGPDAFQVGEEVVEQFAKQGFPMHQIYTWRGEKVEGILSTGHHIDLWRAVKWLLIESGVKDVNIHITGICTYFNSTMYNSARAERNNKCERIINSIMLL